MSDPFIGEIRLVPWNWAPMDWLPCNGQTLPINQYQALYALIGNLYGGTPNQTFALPNLNGRMALGQGQQPGGPNHVVGQFGGAEGATLTQAQLPAHTHAATFTPSGGTPPVVNVADADATLPTPKDNVLAKQALSRGVYANMYAPASAANAKLGGVAGGGGGGTVAIASTGGNTPVPTMPPFQVLYYMIAINGIFPQRP